MRQMKNVFRNLVGEPEEKKPFGRQAYVRV
jgi:hypothetical protein